jgi:hypothetical protein
MGLFFVQDDPAKNAEYVAYVQDRTQPDWLRPIILHWYDTKWYFPRSDREYPNRCTDGPGRCPSAGWTIRTRPSKWNLTCDRY